MKRLRMVFAVASAFCAAALATFAAPAFAKVDHWRTDIGYLSGLPFEPDPAPRKMRATAWMDNRPAEGFGAELTAKVLSMKKKMAEAWARRVSRHYNYTSAASAWT